MYSEEGRKFHYMHVCIHNAMLMLSNSGLCLKGEKSFYSGGESESFGGGRF